MDKIGTLMLLTLVLMLGLSKGLIVRERTSQTFPCTAPSPNLRYWYRGFVNASKPARDEDELFWQFNLGVINRVNARPDMSADKDTFAMTIGDVQLNDTGFFTCYSYDFQNDPVYKQTEYTIVYIQPDKPQITSSIMNNSQVLHGTEVDIECSIDRILPAIDVTQFTMKKGFTNLCSSQSNCTVVTNTNKDGSFTSTLKTRTILYRKDNGQEIECTIEPTYGEEMTSHQIVFTVISEDKGVVLEEHSVHTFKCDLVGDKSRHWFIGYHNVSTKPTPEQKLFVQYNNGPVNRVNARPDMDVPDKETFSLEISDVLLNDTGYFTCYASDSNMGDSYYQTKFFQVYVQPIIPDVTSPVKNNSIVTARSQVKLRCTLRRIFPNIDRTHFTLVIGDTNVCDQSICNIEYSENIDLSFKTTLKAVMTLGLEDNGEKVKCTIYPEYGNSIASYEFIYRVNRTGFIALEEHSSLTFVCTLYGYYTKYWFKGYHNSTTKPTYEQQLFLQFNYLPVRRLNARADMVTPDRYDFSLSIGDVQVNDTGYFTCYGNDYSGSFYNQTEYVQVYVQAGKPDITSSFGNNTVIAPGAEVDIACSLARIFPSLDLTHFTLSKDDINLCDIFVCKVELDVNNDESFMATMRTVVQLNKEDTGKKITCMVEPDYGPTVTSDYLVYNVSIGGEDGSIVALWPDDKVLQICEEGRIHFRLKYGRTFQILRIMAMFDGSDSCEIIYESDGSVAEVKPGFRDDFEQLPDSPHDLQIKQQKWAKAGHYFAQVTQANGKVEEKAFMISATGRAQCTVSTNSSSNGNVIRKGDIVKLMCSVDFSGPISPTMKWYNEIDREVKGQYVNHTSECMKSSTPAKRVNYVINMNITSECTRYLYMCEIQLGDGYSDTCNTWFQVSC